MDFDLSEEQRLLKDSVDGLLADSYDFEARKKHGASKKGWSDEVWNKFAEQGLLGLPFAEADGGFGAGAIETGIVMEALGRALVLEPYFATVVLGGGFLRLGGSPAQRKAHVPDVVSGKKTLPSPSSRRIRATTSATSSRRRKRRVLAGSSRAKSSSCCMATAPACWSSPRAPKAVNATATASACFLSPANANGVRVRGYPTQDGLRAADITFENVEVGADAVLGDPEKGLPLVERVADEARVALCSEAVGAMDDARRPRSNI